MHGAGNGRFGDPSADVVHGTSTRSTFECSRDTNDVLLKSYSIGLSNDAPWRFTSDAAVPVARGPENTRDGTLLKNGEFSPVLSSDFIAYLQNGTLPVILQIPTVVFTFHPFHNPMFTSQHNSHHLSPSTNAC